MVYAQPRIFPREWDTQIRLKFWDTNGLPNLGQTKWLCNNQKKKKKRERTSLIVELKKHESDGNTNCNWCSLYSHEMNDTGTGGLGNKRMSGDHPNSSIIKISLNREASSWDLRRLVFTQTPMRNYRLTLVWKTRKGVKKKKKWNIRLYSNWHFRIFYVYFIFVF